METKTWNLIEAVEWLRQLEATIAPLGFHVGITGSVLYKGSSDNDLDIIVYSHGKSVDLMNLVDNSWHEMICNHLEREGIIRSYEHAVDTFLREHQRGHSSYSDVTRLAIYKAVIFSTGQHIDIFFMEKSANTRVM